MAVRSRCINSFQDRGGGRRFSFRALSALLCAATASCMFLDAREQQGRLAETCRSEEHTSELQSHVNLVCRLLLEKKKIKHIDPKIINLYSHHTTTQTTDGLS